MAWDRGLWRYAGTGGYERYEPTNSGRINPNRESSSNQLDICPLCGKRQPTPRSICISCSYIFNKRDFDLEKFIENVQSKGYKIPSKMMEQFSQNKFFNSPYNVNGLFPKIDKFESLTNSKSKNNKILLVSKNKKVILNLKERLSQNENNKILKLTDDADYNLAGLIESVNKFQKIINSSKYSIKKFDNIESSKVLSDLKYLAENIHYINEKDAEILNDFLKAYWKFWESTQSNDIDLELENKDLEKEISNQTEKFITIKNSLGWFNDNIEKLTKLYDSLGMNYTDVSNKLELMETISILKDNPFIIDLDEKDEFITLLEEYHNQNSYRKPVSLLIEKFDETDISQVYEGYEKYSDSVYQINQAISNLENQFKSYGVNFDKLDLYYSLKEEIHKFTDSIYLNNFDHLLVDRLEEFIENYFDSFKDIIYKDKANLLDSLSNNEVNIEEIVDLNKKIIQIKSILSSIGISHCTINDIKDLKSFCNFNSQYSENGNVITALEELTSKFDSGITLGDYTKTLQIQLMKMMSNIFQKLNLNSNKSFELEYIQYNISIIKQLIKKMGLSVKSISEINKEFKDIIKLSKNSLILKGDYSYTLNDLDIDKTYLFTDNTLVYLKENNESQISQDLNILNISTQSILYEFTNNTNYIYLDDLSNCVDFGSYKVNPDSLELMNKINSFFDYEDFEILMDNYARIFGYAEVLIENSNLNHHKVGLVDLKNNFDEVYEIYGLCDHKYIDDLVNNTSNFLSDLKKSELNHLKLIELQDKGVISEKTKKLIENNQFKVYFDTLNGIIDSINDKYYDLDLDEIINETNNDISNNMKLQKEFKDLYSKIDTINAVNFYDVVLDIKSHSSIKVIPQFNIVLNDYELINEILNLYSNLEIDYGNNLIDLSYDELKSFLEFLNASNKFTIYVNQGIIDKNNFIDFSQEFESIDLKIKDIIQQLFDLNLSQDILNNFAQIKGKNIRKIKRALKKIIDNKEMNMDDMDECMKKMKIMINESYSLCDKHPIEFKYGDKSFNSEDYKLNIFKQRKMLNNYEELLKIENKILSFNEIIHNNLSNIWNGFFTDLNVIKDKFEVDEIFTGLLNKGIFTNKTIENLNLFSDNQLNFIDEFRKALSDEELKENYILVYNNREMLLNEIDNLNEYDITNLIRLKESFEKVNAIFKNSEIDECICLLEYHITKEDNDDIEDYRNELKQYSLIYNKYFGKTEFDLSMEEIINKLNSHLKCTDLINEGIIQEDYLDKIQSDKTNFLKEIDKLERLREDILTKIENFSENYLGDDSIDSSTDFSTIKKYKINLENANIYLSDDNYIKNNFKDYLSYFDYVICDYNVFSDDLKYYLFLTSKNRLSIVKEVDD